ncbi:hypothetical protein C1H46_003322 [Malus baccata]|uniref:Uncharacterized protein n=1 Tax=Malus baccata TaxID=106549 RepID=A0A540NJ40_MALBA|nr:hypothetical protein C1H46_003322 [Malus baccata]
MARNTKHHTVRELEPPPPNGFREIKFKNPINVTIQQHNAGKVENPSKNLNAEKLNMSTVSPAVTKQFDLDPDEQTPQWKCRWAIKTLSRLAYRRAEEQKKEPNFQIIDLLAAFSFIQTFSQTPYMHKEDDRYKKQPDKVQDPTVQSATHKRISEQNLNVGLSWSWIKFSKIAREATKFEQSIERRRRWGRHCAHS